MMVSDIVLRGPLPEAVRKSVELWAGCVAGAMLLEEYLGAIRTAGFSDVTVESEKRAGDLMSDGDAEALLAGNRDISRQELSQLAGLVVSVAVKAVKSLGVAAATS